MEILTPVNEGQVSVESSQQDINSNVSNESQVQSETNSDVAAPKPEQDKDTNSAFAEMRRKTEKLQADYEISKQYGQYGIHTVEDYQKALVEQEAQQKNIDPEFYNEFNSVKNELNNLKRERLLIEQDKKLLNDPKLGEFYKQVKPNVEAIANQYNTDLDTAFTFLLRDKVPELMQKINTNEKNLKNAQTSTGSVNSQGALPQEIISKDTFESNKHDRNWVIKNLTKISQSRSKW